MIKLKHYALLLLAAVTMWSCGDDYDDTQLRNDVSDLQSRVTKLEEWCKTANSQISALQGVVTALEAKDYVTGVTPITEGSETVGYTITFSKSGAVTIKHGANGKDGLNGVTPIIGAAKHTDGLYYWTVKTSAAEATWMLDAAGKMVRTTGNAGATPALSVAQFEGKLYWQVDGKWLLNGDKKVPATGDKGEAGTTGADGDSIFKKDGIDLTDPSNVTLTLADGTTKITFPRTSDMKIFDSFDNFKIAALDVATPLTLALNVKDADYKAIKAELTSSAGLTTAIQTRAAGTPWQVAITAPTFKKDGTVDSQPVVSITVKDAAEGDIALLKVIVIDPKGNEHTSTRVLFYSTKVDVASVSIAETLAVTVGEEKVLAATVLPAGAVQTVTWSSGDIAVATVSSDGKVKGIKAGTAIIKAVSNGNSAKFDECTVTVSTVAVASITLGGDKSVSIGEKVTLVATILPANATVKTVTWISGNPAVATVNAATGEVEGKTVGETTITATSTSNGSVNGTCKVTVTKEKSLEWATGNLVANGANGAKIGAATDNGLYFQFGSLVGWTGRDGQEPILAVKPVAFNGDEGWKATGKIWQEERVVPFIASGSDNEKKGIGDPCRYYLGSTWRLPTQGEYLELIKGNVFPAAGSWTWDDSSKSITNTTLNVTFSAVSSLSSSMGILNLVGKQGAYWSSSTFWGDGFCMNFTHNTLNAAGGGSDKIRGLPVRCVK